MLTCNKCEKTIDIELKIIIKVIPSKATRVCCIYDEPFESDSTYDGYIPCPKCGNDTYNYK